MSAQTETIPAEQGEPAIGKQGSQVGGHTPGPWGARRLTNLTKILSQSLEGFDPLSGENVVAYQYPTDKPTRDEANVRLIAAAPDMLAALHETRLQLQYLADKFGDTGTGAQVLARVNAAIAKATGER